MACVAGTTGNEAAQKFLESLQNDLKNLSIETKKKYPQIKEVRFLIYVALENSSIFFISNDKNVVTLCHSFSGCYFLY